jgi:hypothetical protein
VGRGNMEVGCARDERTIRASSGAWASEGRVWRVMNWGGVHVLHVCVSELERERGWGGESMEVDPECVRDDGNKKPRAVVGADGASPWMG